MKLLKHIRFLPGSGILKGMLVTARNLIGSYYDPRRLRTVRYPEERLPLPENSRSVPFLVYDGDDAETGLRCVACHICETECPARAIHIVNACDKRGKVLKRPHRFEIDISACMGCQICSEVCPFDAIMMDNAYNHAAFERFDSLTLTRERLAKPNAYFHRIKPTEAAEIDSRLAADRSRMEERRRKKEAANATHNESAR